MKEEALDLTTWEIRFRRG